MPGSRPIIPPPDAPKARRCVCDTPICFTEDDGYCCQCGHLYEPPPPASTKRLAETLTRMATGP